MYSLRALLGPRPAPRATSNLTDEDRHRLAMESARLAQVGEALGKVQALHAERLDAAVAAYKAEFGIPDFVVEALDVVIPDNLQHPFLRGQPT
jgi:hypothetical protein